MRKLTYLLFLLGMFVSCKTDKEIQIDRFIQKIETVGLNNFMNIEYFTRDKTEIYSYFLGDTIYTKWKFNNLSNTFEKYDETKMNTLSKNPDEFIKTLQTNIKSIDVKYITQTEWHKSVLKFWLNDTEIVTYVHPKFKFDSAAKEILKEELKSSDKIRDNWYYHKLKVCTNK